MLERSRNLLLADEWFSAPLEQHSAPLVQPFALLKYAPTANKNYFDF